ncbi:MAG: hypothetical protein RL595_2169, partial [Planctomycetota bacterium]
FLASAFGVSAFLLSLEESELDSQFVQSAWLFLENNFPRRPRSAAEEKFSVTNSPSGTAANSAAESNFRMNNPHVSKKTQVGPSRRIIEAKERNGVNPVKIAKIGEFCGL